MSFIEVGKCGIMFVHVTVPVKESDDIHPVEV